MVTTGCHRRPLLPCFSAPMRPFSSLLLSLVSLLTLTTCKRLDGDTLCEGTVVDRHTSARIANATVGVYVGGSSGGGLGGGYVLKEEHQADASGNFAFQINDDAKSMLLLASNSQGYYTIYQEGIYLSGGKNNKKLVLKAQAPAWLRVHIIDQAPRDTAAISLWGFNPNGTGTGALNGRDTVLVVPVQGNVTSQVYWQINRIHHPLTYGNQDIYCPGLDTTSLQVAY